MTITELTVKMIDKASGNLHDICHFLKVHSYAKMIGEMEKLDEETQFILEVAAVIHDIACPLCREKYGSTLPDKQESEGMPMTAEFLAEYALPADFVERVVWLVGHHHTLSGVETMGHRILLEADYLVNAHESSHSLTQIHSAEKTIFRTQTGLRLLRDMYY